jgi:hypothetical protein
MSQQKDGAEDTQPAPDRMGQRVGPFLVLSPIKRVPLSVENFQRVAIRQVLIAQTPYLAQLCGIVLPCGTK